MSKACGCSVALDEAMDTISRIDAGFGDKVIAQARASDDQLVRTARQKAKRARSNAEK